MGLIAVVAVFYVVGYALIPAINTGNWTDIAGLDMSWILIIVVLLIFISIAMAIYYHFKKKS